MLADKLIGIAEKEGVAIGCIKNMRSWLRPAIIAQYISDKGMIGFVVNNGGIPMLAPPGGYDPVIGTNPIGIGIPTEKTPILIDMATSKRAWGEVRKSKTLGSALPEKTFYTKIGDYATHPDAAYSVEAMRRQNQEFIDWIKTTHTLPGFDEIFISGERAMKTRQKNLENGYLEIDDSLWEAIVR